MSVLWHVLYFWFCNFSHCRKHCNILLIWLIIIPNPVCMWLCDLSTEETSSPRCANSVFDGHVSVTVISSIWKPLHAKFQSHKALQAARPSSTAEEKAVPDIPDSQAASSDTRFLLWPQALACFLSVSPTLASSPGWEATALAHKDLGWLRATAPHTWCGLSCWPAGWPRWHTSLPHWWRWPGCSSAQTLGTSSRQLPAASPSTPTALEESQQQTSHIDSRLTTLAQDTNKTKINPWLTIHCCCERLTKKSSGNIPVHISNTTNALPS